MKFSANCRIAVLVACATGVVCQAPASSPAYAILNTLPLSNQPSGASIGLPTLDSQISYSSIFGAIKAYEALGVVYDSYKLSGNWSMVPQVKMRTGTFYVACHTYTPGNINASVTVLHPTLPVGSTVAQVTANGNPLLYGDLIEIFAAAAASGPYDSELFFARYYNAVGALGSQANFIKSALGKFIGGSGTDPSVVCICGFQNEPLPASSPVSSPAASFG